MASDSAEDEDGLRIVRNMEAPGSPEDAIMAEEASRQRAPDLFTKPPPIKDALITESTTSQYRVINQCLPYLAGIEVDRSRLNLQSVPKLKRDKHIQFLETAIKYARFTGLDASRPWVVYWSLTGLSLLGKDIEVYRERYISTIITGDVD